MPPVRVLVDMDGVLADFEASFLRLYRSRHPQLPYVALDERRGFSVEAQYRQLDPGLAADFVRNIYGSPNFFLDLVPIPGAVEAMQEMFSLNETEVFICTSPILKYEYCVKEKYAWVEKHLGPQFVQRLVMSRDKTIVSADLLIDDKVDIKGVEPNPSWEHIVFTCWHNRHTELEPHRRRLESWSDDWKAIIDGKRRE
ncbi:5'(3')-deoxyribonucleotidase, mitochondrial [Callorhinchus milii]|uniref:5'(3')-deoxyribonucleotidase, mitochondrial n=1 Tax=Callorhinchus milii TaxID=7868 RepID=UPI001C3F69AF|nr:5'(3')-deoxyribonucleotidase, mitochondrial [Callorhinchus milii]